MKKFENIFEKIFEIHMNGSVEEFKSDYKTLFNKVILKSVEIYKKELLNEPLEIIDYYLNAGCKTTRTLASKKGLSFYERTTGKKYINKIDR